MNSRQPRLSLVGASLQLGIGGIQLVSSSNSAIIQLPSGTLTTLSIATPTSANHAATKSYVDTSTSVYNISGSPITNTKRIVAQTTCNSSGAWSITVPNIGQSEVLSVKATAISSSTATIPSLAIAHITSYSITSITGYATEGTTITSVLVGSAPSLVAAPSGTVIMVDILVL
jgi:hypothetical protein